MSRLFVSFLNTLNDDLGEELPAAKGDVAAAVDVVAAEWDMKLIAVSHHPITGEEDGNCRIYWSREFRRYVNCWLEAPSDKVGPGGIGFDDQIDWWEDEEARMEDKE
jgi:hypothetical protein